MGEKRFPIDVLENMEPAIGIEPTTCGLRIVLCTVSVKRINDLAVQNGANRCRRYANPQLSATARVVIAIQDLREEALIVAARVRERFRKAKKNESLQIWRGEYLEVL